MKKIIALLLLAVMCFSLVACGGGRGSNSDVESAKKEIVGEWKNFPDDHSFTFNEDGTGITPSNGTLTWKYDSELSCYSVYIENGKTLSVSNINTAENGARYVYINGNPYYNMSDYDKAVEVVYSKLYESAMKHYDNNNFTKIEIGKSITTKDGKFTATLVDSYVENGNLYLKATLKNNTDSEYPVDGSDISIFETNTLHVIYDGARGHTQTYGLNFRAEDEKTDTVINAGESINVVALLAREMKTNISFCGISFNDKGTRYWIDLSEYVK